MYIARPLFILFAAEDLQTNRDMSLTIPDTPSVRKNPLIQVIEFVCCTARCYCLLATA